MRVLKCDSATRLGSMSLLQLEQLPYKFPAQTRWLLKNGEAVCAQLLASLAAEGGAAQRSTLAAMIFPDTNPTTRLRYLAVVIEFMVANGRFTQQPTISISRQWVCLYGNDVPKKQPDTIAVIAWGSRKVLARVEHGELTNWCHANGYLPHHKTGRGWVVIQ